MEWIVFIGVAIVIGLLVVLIKRKRGPQDFPTPFGLMTFYRKEAEDLCGSGFYTGTQAYHRDTDVKLRPLFLDAMQRSFALIGYCLRMDGMMNWPRAENQAQYIELRRRYATERLELDALFKKIGCMGFVSTPEEAKQLADMMANPAKTAY